MKNIKNKTFGVLLGGLLLPALLSSPVQADELHVAASYSTDHLNGLRVGYRWTDGPKILPESWFALVGSPRVHWELGLNTWVNSRHSDDRLNALTFSPVLQWTLTQSNRPLFLEAGIGVSLLDDQQISDRDLSISFQFEDRIGLSWQYDPISEARLSFSYAHYSQADLARPNDGLDFWVLTWHVPI
ncbi:Lipid A 3-O-deacylase (PagL) [Pseudidiomarina indica]|uniref:Lipid A 3-O-deacylase (PagL) n=1 Tax=Pseudidiomarina indica TaxID=1159017 RepID=A0A1G6BFK8_9GAMM|nr:acyloxyacyl hydrolase [Pseudidiomarina indica]SDB19336.1 Lipid A 3-O-deacylase (PagL) [Pseudidiomarina indica]